MHPAIVFLQRLLLYMQWCARTIFTKMLCMPPERSSFSFFSLSIRTVCTVYYTVYRIYFPVRIL